MSATKISGSQIGGVCSAGLSVKFSIASASSGAHTFGKASRHSAPADFRAAVMEVCRSAIRSPLVRLAPAPPCLRRRASQAIFSTRLSG
jgi:hypothetical protein